MSLAAAAVLAAALLARADAPPAHEAGEPLTRHPTSQPPAHETHEIMLDLGPGARSVPGAAIAAPPASAQADAAAWSGFCRQANGATVMTRAGDYLGVIADRSQPDSIFNPLGAYGGRLSPTSIWNASGRFGGATGPHSPFSRTGTPPLVVDGDQVIAILTDDGAAPGAADPATIARMCYGCDEYLDHAPERR